jgi:hypothetical protein
MISIEPIKKFLLEGTINRSWLDVGPYRAYIRAGYRHIDGHLTKTVEIANIVREDQKDNARGRFWQLIEELQCFLVNSPELGFKVIYIESVINADLRASLSRRGFKRKPQCYSMGTSDDCVDYWINVTDKVDLYVSV